MISVKYLETLIDYMATLLFFGFRHQYSYGYMEDKISSSDFIKSLELSRGQTIYGNNVTDILKSIYPHEQITDNDLQEINSLSLWMGEAYFRLFFKFHKTMYYIFLYIPIERMIELYNLYHEQDWTQLYKYFFKLTQETTLLKKLLQKRQLSVNKLSQLTGVSKNTLTYYCLNDDHLYEAKYAYIDAIAYALDVDTRLFLKEIHNYTNSETYDFDKWNKEYRSYLGLYLVSYFALDIRDRNYKYNQKRQCFFSGDNRLLVETVENKDGDIGPINEIVESVASKTDENERKKTILVIFEYGYNSESVKPFQSFLSYGFERIYLINKSSVLTIKENSSAIYLPNSVNESMIEKAKKKVGGDFAI